MSNSIVKFYVNVDVNFNVKFDVNFDLKFDIKFDANFDVKCGVKFIFDNCHNRQKTSQKPRQARSLARAGMLLEANS